MAEIDRLRDRPLREGLDHVANLVQDWSGGQLRDDVSLLAVERMDVPQSEVTQSLNFKQAKEEP